jgi:divinyl protochlorophyllide a 8-vinyl-reductase
MPDGAQLFGPETEARVGPNAILQLKDPMDQLLGRGVLAQLLDLCRVEMPSGTAMISQSDVGRVHHTLWQLFPHRAQAVSEEAGRGTAEYIRKNRIPRVARIALRLMPRGMAEQMLAKAIADHAWTFCGSGGFGFHREDGDIHFMIHANPLADVAAHPPHPCHWHSAVFEALFSRVLGRRYHCREVSCCAMQAERCHFVVTRGAPKG